MPSASGRLARSGLACLLPLLAACAAPVPVMPPADPLPPVARHPATAVAASAVVPAPEPLRPAPDYRLRIEREADIPRGAAAATLAAVAAAARGDDALYVHVEGYAAGAGSPALKLGWNDRVLRLIRARLLAQGADGRRIYLYNRGETDTAAGAPAAHVEIFLVRG